MMLARSLLTMALALGLDSFIAGLAVGTLRLSWRTRFAFAALLGVADGAATLLGAAISHALPAPPEALLYLLAAAALVLAARHSRAWLFSLPLWLSLDNLAAGAPAAEAPALALSSMALALAGLALAALGRFVATRAAARIRAA
ncbi:MAG TPA: hypothetical protein VME92_04705 [Acetobacteraceae bacterium]|nr:hypothetical protein [Acetobacteraceae bacterium]